MKRQFTVSFYDCQYYDVPVEVDDTELSEYELKEKARQAALDLLAKNCSLYFAGESDTWEYMETEEMNDEEAQIIL